MALLELPLANQAPAFDFFVDLEGKTYQFVFRWQGRIEVWVFDLYDGNGNAIQTGNPFIVDVPLFQQLVNSDAPPGRFGTYNSNEAGVNADRFNIGGDVKLFYDESTS